MDVFEACKRLSLPELLDVYELPDGTSKHLLILYSLVVGTNAKVILDIGLGRTTGALRAAASRTGGIVHTADFDQRRFAALLEQQDEAWRLYLEPTGSFLQRFSGPVDFVMHDGAHDYEHVVADLRLILPQMRQFGMVCIHDTQQPDLYADMLGALGSIASSYPVSIVNLPFSSGLAIMRVEEGEFPPIQPVSGILPDGRSDTHLVPFALRPEVSRTSTGLERGSLRSWLRARKIEAGHALRQLGLRS
jgi:hypothetical protein